MNFCSTIKLKLMRIRNVKPISLITALACLLGVAFNSPLRTTSAQEVDYQSDVQPILDKHCLACHNEDDSEAGFIATSFETLSEGYDDGEVYVASKSLESTIIRLMNGDDQPLMPPDDCPRPTEDEIELIANWIDAGAKPSATPSTMPPPNTEDNSDVETIKVPDLGRAVSNGAVDGIGAADWSPTGDWIASGSFQKVILAPQLEGYASNGGSITLDGVAGKVNSLRFSKDGTWLIASSGITGKSGQAIVWDVESRKEVQSFLGHTDAIYAAAISHDKSVVATASYDRRIILWDVESGKQLRKLLGHNGAVYDIDFSPDSKSLISASADQTLKLWNVETGERIETFGQPLKEQLTCRFSPDGKTIVGAGRDNRIRIWSHDPQPNSNVDAFQQSIFAHEGPIVELDFSKDGSRLVSTSEDATTKVWDTNSFQPIQTINNPAKHSSATAPDGEVASALAISPDGTKVYLGDMCGNETFVKIVDSRNTEKEDARERPIDNRKPEDRTPSKVTETEPNNETSAPNQISIGDTVAGKISVNKETSASMTDVDLFRFTAKQGQRLVLEVTAQQDGSEFESQLDSKIEILDESGKPVPRVILHATLDSYFTFRGKDSDNTDDIRIHNWREMDINQFLYCNGEVMRLFQHPRGPDSGFLVYPGTGKRHGYFGTTPIAHPLHEPCYLVKPYPVGTKLPANGLPTFTINYENDDATLRDIGKDSRLLFDPPSDGQYLVRVSDVRAFSGDDFKYQLHVRDAEPGFSVAMKAPKEIIQGGGQEIELIAKRIDGYVGPIQVSLENLPDGIKATSPVLIECGHERALLTVHATDSDISKADVEGIKWKASAIINGETTFGNVEKIEPFEIKSGKPKIELRIVQPDTGSVDAFAATYDDPIVFQIRPGEMIEAKVIAKRNNHDARISLGLADAGRNLPRGVYVDDIGLNGLMITKGNTEQAFYLTCDDWVAPQTRAFYVRATDVGNEISWPVIIEILSKK